MTDSFKEKILQCLREGNREEAIDVIKKCKVNRIYVDTFTEFQEGETIETNDVIIEASEDTIETMGNEEKEQIELAVHTCASSNQFHVRNIQWKEETEGSSPKLEEVKAACERMDSDHIYKKWKELRKRQAEDPKQVFETSKTLLRTVCQYILDKKKVSYPEDDLKEQFRLVSEELQIDSELEKNHTLRHLFGNCNAIVRMISKLSVESGSDQGLQNEHPLLQPGITELILNLAGSVTAFLISQWNRAS